MTLVPNHHERQLMQRLRGRDWVKGSHFPPTKVIGNLLEKGWIERRGTAQDLEYRITDVGLSAKTALIPEKQEGIGRPRLTAEHLRSSEKTP
jgi:hypothetical protein